MATSKSVHSIRTFEELRSLRANIGLTKAQNGFHNIQLGNKCVKIDEMTAKKFIFNSDYWFNYYKKISDLHPRRTIDILPLGLSIIYQQSPASTCALQFSKSKPPTGKSSIDVLRHNMLVKEVGITRQIFIGLYNKSRSIFRRYGYEYQDYFRFTVGIRDEKLILIVAYKENRQTFSPRNGISFVKEELQNIFGITIRWTGYVDYIKRKKMARTDFGFLNVSDDLRIPLLSWIKEKGQSLLERAIQHNPFYSSNVARAERPIVLFETQHGGTMSHGRAHCLNATGIPCVITLPALTYIIEGTVVLRDVIPHEITHVATKGIDFALWFKEVIAISQEGNQNIRSKYPSTMEAAEISLEMVSRAFQQDKQHAFYTVVHQYAVKILGKDVLHRVVKEMREKPDLSFGRVFFDVIKNGYGRSSSTLKDLYERLTAEIYKKINDDFGKQFEAFDNLLKLIDKDNRGDNVFVRTNKMIEALIRIDQDTSLAVTKRLIGFRNDIIRYINTYPNSPRNGFAYQMLGQVEFFLCKRTAGVDDKRSYIIDSVTSLEMAIHEVPASVFKIVRIGLAARMFIDAGSSDAHGVTDKETRIHLMERGKNLLEEYIRLTELSAHDKNVFRLFNQDPAIDLTNARALYTYATSRLQVN